MIVDGHLPLPGNGPATRSGAARRRRRDVVRRRRRRCSTSRPMPTRPCIASASRPRRSGCDSPSWGSTTARCGRRSSAGPGDRGVRAGRRAHVAVPVRAVRGATDGDQHVTGAVLLMRDVSELRKRDRLLLSKDATIREIHHRVKNNLQTISSLLRLQARRLTNPGGDLGGRRFGAADPHDRTRARGPVARARRRRHLHRDRAAAAAPRRGRPAIGRSTSALHRPRRRRADPRRDRHAAVGRAHRAAAKRRRSRLPRRKRRRLRWSCSSRTPTVNCGVGRRRRARASSRVRLEDATGLGLSIVRTLVTTELDGRIEMRPPRRLTRGRRARAIAGPARGTVVELFVPLGEE